MRAPLSITLTDTTGEVIAVYTDSMGGNENRGWLIPPGYVAPND
ncbi:MAG: hypothetical protein AAFR73_01945 [Pseudomonadota bacterium]